MIVCASIIVEYGAEAREPVTCNAGVLFHPAHLSRHDLLTMASRDEPRVTSASIYR